MIASGDKAKQTATVMSDVDGVQKYADWRLTAASATPRCWLGTSTTTPSVVTTSRTAAVAAMTTALRPRKNASLSACGSLI